MRFTIPVLSLTRHQQDPPVELDGFFEGANGTSVETGLERIQARFDKQRTTLQKDSVGRTKHLEAEVVHLDNIKPGVDRQWAAISQLHADQIPSVVTPLIIALVGTAAIAAEARMLAPALDLLNVTDYSSQLFSAMGIASITALAYHFAWETFTKDDLSRVRKLALRIMAGVLTLGMTLWGILRGRQVGFGADLAESPLGQFLRDHSFLSSSFYVLITLAVPVIAATATQYSHSALEKWWRWHTISSQLRNFSKRRSYAIKLLESEQETLSHGQKELDHQAKEAKALYARSHARGVLNGTRQEPYWTVPLKSTLAAMVALIACGWFIFFLSPFFALIPVTVWIGAFFHYRRQWRSPNPVEFFELEKVKFAIAAADARHSEHAVTVGDVRRTLKEGGSN